MIFILLDYCLLLYLLYSISSSPKPLNMNDSQNSFFDLLFSIYDFPGGSDNKSVCLQSGRPRFNLWVRKILWRRKWQPTAVFLPGKSHGRKSLAGYSPWGCRVRHDWATNIFTFFSSLPYITTGHIVNTDQCGSTWKMRTICAQTRLRWHSMPAGRLDYPSRMVWESLGPLRPF